MASWRPASRQGSAPLVPTVILTRGEQVLRKEYPRQRLSIGIRAEADLQFQAAGLPDHHPFLTPTRRGLEVFLTEEMEGVVTRGERRIAVSELIELGVLPSRNGVHALTLREGMELRLAFGDHALEVRYAAKPLEAPLPPRRIRTSAPTVREKLVFNPNFRFAEIPVVEDEQPLFFGGLFGIGLLYALALMGLVWAIQFVKEPPTIIVTVPIPRQPPIWDTGIDLPKKTTETPPVAQPGTKDIPKVTDIFTPENTKFIAKKNTKVESMPEIEGIIQRIQSTSNGPLERTRPEAEIIIGHIPTGPVGIDDVIAKHTTIDPAAPMIFRPETVTDPTHQQETAPGKERRFAAIQRVMLANAGAFKALYNRLLRKYPQARGRIEVTFTIRPDGSVHDAVVSSSDFGAWPEFEKDFLRRLGRIEFGAIPESAGSVRISFPFAFNN